MDFDWKDHERFLRMVQGLIGEQYFNEIAGVCKTHVMEDKKLTKGLGEKIGYEYMEAVKQAAKEWSGKSDRCREDSCE